ncbi:MAG: PAS domain S-box protein [Deltaproteobacteria bacterium]|nr:PAS domain S-box protein [Deltaproteobacteria bacterium]
MKTSNNPSGYSISLRNIFFKVLAVIFLAELFIMSILHIFLPEKGIIVETFLDVTALAIVMIPFLWYLVIKPFSETLTKTHLLFESSPDCMCHISLDGKFISMNRAGLKLNGLDSPEEVIGKDCTASIIDNKVLAEDAVRTAAKGESISLEYKSVNKNGAEIWWDSKLTPIKDSNGNITSILRVSRDITAQKSLVKTIEQITSIIESTSDLVGVASPDKRLIYINKAGREMLGIGLHDDISKTYIPDYHPEWAYNIVLNKGIPFAIQHGTWTGETAILTRSRTEIPLSQTIIAHKRHDGSVKFFSTIARDISKSKQLEYNLIKSREHLAHAQAIAHIGSWEWDIEKGGLYWSDETYRLFGLKPYEITPAYEDFLNRAHHEDRGFVRRSVNEAVYDKRPYSIEHRIILPDNSVRFMHSEGKVTFDEDNRAILMSGTSQDITEHKKLETQLRHAQKMDAVGKLAGGIAHEFNNILTSIIGYTYILQKKLNNDPLITYTRQILASSERAANLIRGLLEFSRKDLTPSKRAVNLNEIVKESIVFIEGMIGEDIKIEQVLSDEKISVIADRGQIEQVLMNLAANARDAMPDGGVLIIKTKIIEMDDGFIKAHGFGKNGRYAVILFADTGKGMDEKTREHIFEPFFTTKDVGKGTGLGLAIVYGMIEEHSGYINVYSEQGKGTEFTIYLPFTEEKVTIETRHEVTLLGGKETILVVDDDCETITAVKTFLEEFGYKVIEADSGESAIRLFEENKEGIGLVILDVIMPDKNGKEVYDEMKKIRPDIKTIFVSGYGADMLFERKILEHDMDFICKPFILSQFLTKVREVLDR